VLSGDAKLDEVDVSPWAAIAIGDRLKAHCDLSWPLRRQMGPIAMHDVTAIGGVAAVQQSAANSPSAQIQIPQRYI